MTDTQSRVHWSVTRHRFETRCPDCGTVCWDWINRLVPKRLDQHRRLTCPERAR